MALGFIAAVASPEVPTHPSVKQAALGASFNKIAGPGSVSATADESPSHAMGDVLRAQVRQFLATEQNAFEATSMVHTASEALGEIDHLLGRMRSILEAGSNDPLTPIDRGKLQREFSGYQSQLNKIKQTTSYNGVDLLSSNARPVSFEVGHSVASNGHLRVELGEFDWAPPAIDSVGTRDPAVAQAARGSIDNALRKVALERASLGAVLNQLNTATQSTQTQRLNLTASSSSVRDTSVAEEMAKLTRNQVLRQPGVSVLSQTRQLPQLSLNLLR